MNGGYDGSTVILRDCTDFVRIFFMFLVQK